MLYSLVKILVRLAVRIFCRRIEIQGHRYLETAGPLLIVANHPNSFLDAIIIGAFFEKKVHFLARGDAFHKPWHNFLLRLLHMIPVYRLSEGRENLSLNEKAFQQSSEILQKGGVVLIFIEGICVHKHELQPFKKGAARIAFENRSLKGLRVLPAGIAYDSFERFGKNISLQICPPFSVHELMPYPEEVRNYKQFNSVLYETLKVHIRVPPKEKKRPVQTRILFFLPALAGYVLHAPLYYPLRNFIRKKTRGTVFYDSVLMGALLLLYPLYLLILFLLLASFGASLQPILVLLLLHPLLAWFAVSLREQLNF
ncbi:MAG: 1-acyl-sn-glycerol-3-phosphate acyltransferase [Bacteroidota bacterium]|nr:1-acyl-sn-glycerol-3-phosphate acyltransferase [Bacteroidota bacterium]